MTDTILIPNFERHTRGIRSMTLERIETRCNEFALKAAQADTGLVKDRYTQLHAAYYAERGRRYALIDLATYGEPK